LKTGSARPQNDGGPFKGAQSYGPADGDLFYGREAQGTALARFISDRPVSVLSAPSGIGKTSLLHAMVLPLLEKEGWLVVYARPQDDPLRSVHTALVDHMLPDPGIEAGVIERLAAVLPANQPPALQAALEWHAELPAEQRVAMQLLAPASGAEFAPLPMICRALRRSIEITNLIEHFEAVVADGRPLGLTPHTSLRELAERLRADEIAVLWRSWTTRLTTARDLAEALRLFREEWAPLRPGLHGVLLVLDQFEEIFTRLPTTTIESLKTAVRLLIEPCATDATAIPVHFNFSLRKEFFADVVPHFGAFGPVERRLTFFLEPMSVDEARRALSRPAALFGLTFAGTQTGDPGCLERVLALTLDDRAAVDRDNSNGEKEAKARLPEGRHYAPTLISLVGAHLWSRLKAETSRLPAPLTWEAFTRLVPGLVDVFESFLRDALARIDQQNDDHHATSFDALELLDRLVTSTGFRNIVAEEQLLDQLPLPRDTARKLLELMDHEVRLIRRESRRGGRIVEIIHERLIPPARQMLSELRRQDVVRAALAPARDMLRMLPDEPDPITRDPLPAHFREALFSHLDRLDLDSLAAKNLLRSLLVTGPAGGASGQALHRWSEALIKLAGVAASSTPRAGSRMLLVDAELDAALNELDRQGRMPDSDMARHILWSALADRSDLSGDRIHRACRDFISLERSR
jgi:hypothetical protein